MSDSGQINKSSVDSLFSSSNSMSSSQQPLYGREVASGYVKKLGRMIENHIGALVEKELDALLCKCGLIEKMYQFRDSLGKDVATPLAEIEETSPAALLECLKDFFGLVLGSENSLPEFKKMQVPKLRSEACNNVAKMNAEAYGHPEPKSLARHPPDQISTVLGI